MTGWYTVEVRTPEGTAMSAHFQLRPAQDPIPGIRGDLRTRGNLTSIAGPCTVVFDEQEPWHVQLLQIDGGITAYYVLSETAPPLPK